MQLHAVVPVNIMARAKSRLAGVLSPIERRALVREMLLRVLKTLNACAAHTPRAATPALTCGGRSVWEQAEIDPWAWPPLLSAVWVVSADPEALALAGAGGARPLRVDTGDLNRDLEQARKVVRAAGADAMLVLHADLPLVTCDDIVGLSGALASGADMVIAPDEAMSGTNALGLWLAADLPFQFGPSSFARHNAAAAWRELIVEVYRSPTLALDVDTPAGLERYRAIVR